MKSPRTNPLLFGTLLLTGTGLIVRVIGFFYRIFLSRMLGAESMGIYQLIFPAWNVCYALCCSSLQTALSRFIAVETAKEADGNPHAYLLSGCLLALFVSLSLAAVLYLQSGWIASALLLEPRCAPLLRILALALPFNAVHACIYGYYYGRKRAEVPSLAQLVEQIVRVATVLFLYLKKLEAGETPDVTLAVAGLAAGEIAALLFSFVCITRLLSTERKEIGRLRLSSAVSFTRSLFRLYLPLCLNRLTLNLLQSAESVLIPGSLQVYGCTASDALSLYGVFTGMALPFILFPTAVTNSLAVMLLPDIAEASARSDTERISRTTGLTVRYCLYIGILFVGIFLCYGPAMGSILFHNANAGHFIRTLAWLCPFLYLSGTLGSILNGLELASQVFLHSLAGLALRLAFVVFGIPRLGIQAYLYGTLISQLLTTALHLGSLCRRFPIQFDAGYALIRPLAACALCAIGVRFLQKKTALVLFGSPFLTLAAQCALFALGFLFLIALTRDRENPPALP